MGVINEFFVVPEELIKRRLKEKFNIYDYIYEELLLFHDYKALPFWRTEIQFSTNKGWNATQEILNHLDESGNQLLNKISFGENHFNGLYYKMNSEVAEIWEYLKRISIVDIENFLSIESNRDKIKLKDGYRLHWVDNESAMIENYVTIFNVYFTAINRKIGILNQLS